MTEIRNGVSAALVTGARWRKGSRSGAVGNCVEVSPVGDGRTAIRDSKAPSGPTLVFHGQVIRSFATAARGGVLRMPTAETYLRRLVARGYDFLHPRDAKGEIAAVVGVRAHNNVIDVIRLHAEDNAIASRLPSDAADVLNPSDVLWQRAGWATDVLRDLIALPDDRTPGAMSRPRGETSAAGCWIPTAPGRAKWLPATA
ncbi:hypothetical protein [Alloactinosynnema sp. L-07]|uniref:DUF397 domain-containing protein n=1 Tax=Alloactinosynnema sp. L-07 TaxID=1653480 RepID=UPI00065EF41C|nr:DUF397 domain-containing protein [Alloactinosynnema sp. L-07]CRK58931.1 hypothetical protein [Alloactinosynnema sp. L-07]